MDIKRYKKTLSSLSSIISIILVLCMACSIFEPTAGAQSDFNPEVEAAANAFVDTYGFIPLLTGNKEYGSIIIHENGERVVTMTKSDNRGNIEEVTGVVWLSPDDESFIVYAGGDGFPEQARMGDYSFIFSNYTSNSVDITTISPDGKREVHKDIPVDLDKFSSLKSKEYASLDFSFPQNNDLTPWETVVLGARLLSIAGCGVAIIMSYGTASLLCAGAIISGINMYRDLNKVEPNDGIMDAGLTSSGLTIGSLACPHDLGSCVSTTVELVEVIVKSAETKSRVVSSANGDVKVDPFAQSSPGLSLTPEEKANEGEHTYQVNCTLLTDNTLPYQRCDCNDEFVTTLSINFTNDSLIFQEYDDYPFNKTDTNTYYSKGENAQNTIIFTLTGFFLIGDIIDPDCSYEWKHLIIDD